MNERTREQFDAWRSQPGLAADLAAELEEIAGNDREIEDRFYKDLSFGTGGLRGVLGAGTNRLNVYTVARATAGLARYLQSQSSAPACAIACDTRRKSDEFARVTAAVLAGAGVQVHLYQQPAPTPMLSFAVRALHCTAGVVITASHNPAQYNGYKVYGPDGCQLTLEGARAVQQAIDSQPGFVPLPAFDALLSAGKIRYIAQDVARAYDSAVLAQCPSPLAAPLRVVYSPLNGTGNQPVRRVLAAMGVQVDVVALQEQPDGDFPTCPYPNPEEPEAMKLAVEQCRESGADFCLATDPDCDRVGVAAIGQDGRARLFSGNEMGVLLLDYICRARAAAGTMPARPVAVKTIVTTEMASAVAAAYGVELRNVLTGFKFIGEQIGRLEAAGEAGRFIFGMEESYGYLSGTYVRDKDGVNAAALICAMAADYKARGLTLNQAMEALEARFGCYKTAQVSAKFEGPTGMERMEALMDSLREGCRVFAGLPVAGVTDYLNDNTGLPKSNVLALRLAEGCSAVVRPSGTEPKLKLYLTARGSNAASAALLLEKMEEQARAWVQAAQQTEGRH